MTITRLGGIVATAPVAFAIAALLVLEGERRLALWWSLLFAAGLGVVVATKMAFIGWGMGIRPLDFTGISGHAMRAMAVTPVLAYLLLQNTPSYVRISGMLAGIAFGAIIGISRVVLHAHSVSEVVAGWLLGAIVAIGFIRLSGPLQKNLFTPTRIAFGMTAMLAVALYAKPAPTQHWLTEASLYLSGRDKPFVRTGWKAAHPPVFIHKQS